MIVRDKQMNLLSTAPFPHTRLPVLLSLFPHRALLPLLALLVFLALSLGTGRVREVKRRKKRLKKMRTRSVRRKRRRGRRAESDKGKTEIKQLRSVVQRLAA